MFGVIVAACAGNGPTLTPTFTLPSLSATIEPPTSTDRAATEAAADRLRRLLAGEVVVGDPSLLAWEDVERQVLPLTVGKDAFCEALDVPRADDVLTQLIAMGLTALARRRGGGDLSDETKAVLGLAVQFSIKTCPAWKPALLPVPTLAPLPESPIAGFTVLRRDPATSWRLVPTAETACPPTLRLCWQTELFALNGCPTHAEMSIAVTDAAGVPRGLAVDLRAPVTPGETVTFSYGAWDATHQAEVYSVTCY